MAQQQTQRAAGTRRCRTQQVDCTGLRGSLPARLPPGAPQPHEAARLVVAAAISSTSAAATSSSHQAWPCSDFRPMHRLSRSQLCSVVAQVAVSGHSPSRSWLDQCADFARPHLRSLSPRQLAGLISSFVAMRYHPGEEFIADFDTAVVSHPHAFDPSSITDILACLAALGATWTRFPRFVALRLTMAAAAHNAAHNTNANAASRPPAAAATPAPPSSSPSAAAAAAHQALDSWSHPQLSLTLRCLHSCFAVPVDEATLLALGRCMARQLACMEAGEAQATMRRELARPPSTAAWSFSASTQ